MKKHILNIAVVALGLVGLLYLPVPRTNQAANISQIPAVSSFDFKIQGETSGTGTYFEIKDSDYLTVSLQSSNTITASFSSRPRVISLVILPSSVSSAQLTISGLAPNTQYYLFDNSYKNETPFNSSPTGSYTWTQNISGPHHVWLQETKGTIFIPDNCNAVGTFNNSTSTCTLNQNINNNIEITTDGVTLDCNNHARSGGFVNFGILLNNRQNVTVKNCVVSNASLGIAAFLSDNNTFLNNTTSNNSGVGIAIGSLSDANTVSNNTSLNNNDGILVNNATDNIVNDNTAQFNFFNGIAIVGSFTDTARNTIRSNQITNNANGVLISGFVSQFNTIVDNTISNNNLGIGIDMPGSANNNKVFNNNLISNSVQAFVSALGPNLFDNGLPDGGNYWSDFDTPAEGCSDSNSDKFCDASRVISTTPDIKDNFPWTVQDGWKGPVEVDINLSWSENKDPDFESYRIFRDTNAGVDLNDTLIATITDRGQTSFVDRGLDAGITYFYKIFVFDKIGLSSGSNEKSIEF